MSDPRDVLERASVVAVVGCSTNPGKAAHRIPADLQAAGYRVIPVHPSAAEILGERAYRSLADSGADRHRRRVPPAERRDRPRGRVGAKGWAPVGIRSPVARPSPPRPASTTSRTAHRADARWSAHQAGAKVGTWVRLVAGEVVEEVRDGCSWRPARREGVEEWGARPTWRRGGGEGGEAVVVGREQAAAVVGPTAPDTGVPPRATAWDRRLRRTGGVGQLLMRRVPPSARTGHQDP